MLFSKLCGCANIARILPSPSSFTQVIEALSKAGADINELNSFRKFFSQTKGGKLAEATYPAQVTVCIAQGELNSHSLLLIFRWWHSFFQM